jgi:hypothetical protein
VTGTIKPIDPKFGIAMLYRLNPEDTIQFPEKEPVIVNTVTGEPIPDDEPLMIFRARDRHALPMLRYYAELCARDICTEFHMLGIFNRLEAFEKFAKDHPERMKQPGITRGL